MATAGESAALSKELSDFPIEFSIGLHEHAINGAGHPLLENTEWMEWAPRTSVSVWPDSCMIPAKCAFPTGVLTKPGKLTDEGWVVMRRHPADGTRIIYESDRDLDLAAAVAYEHHIMVNGQGYPRRHFERGVHAASKLVHVCDVYDALRTTRPYREAWESDRVMRQIEQGMGTDREVESATAFCTLVRQWERREAMLS